jgi:hypothetical protein
MVGRARESRKGSCRNRCGDDIVISSMEAMIMAQMVVRNPTTM